MKQSIVAGSAGAQGPRLGCLVWKASLGSEDVLRPGLDIAAGRPALATWDNG